MITECSYCGSEVVFVSTYKFYGVDYGSSVYTCTKCDAYVGTHKGTTKPLGTLANKELRALRSQAHGVVDPCWKGGHMQRSSAYRRLQEFMGTKREETHIGMFNEAQCREIIRGFKQFVLTKGRSRV